MSASRARRDYENTEGLEVVGKCDGQLLILAGINVRASHGAHWSNCCEIGLGEEKN